MSLQNNQDGSGTFQSQAYDPITPIPPSLQNKQQHYMRVIHPPMTLPTLNAHQLHHRTVAAWMTKTIAEHRSHIGIESYWNIYTVVRCPIDLPTAEGQVSWDPDHNTATIELRCDFTQEMSYHILIHELLELQDWETAEIFLSTLPFLRTEDIGNFLLGQYRTARNRKIETQVTRYTGKLRPMPTPHTAYEEMPLEELSPGDMKAATMKRTAIRINTNRP